MNGCVVDAISHSQRFHGNNKRNSRLPSGIDIKQGCYFRINSRESSNCYSVIKSVFDY